MKALELENYGVSELAFSEQEETDGGWFWPALYAVLAVGAVIDVIHNAKKSYDKGVAAGEAAAH